MNLPKRNRIDGNKKKIFREKYKNYINQGKPNCFWYSCYNSWYNWIIKEGMDSLLHNYIHKINIKSNIITDIWNKDKNKLLVIKNISDFEVFHKRYSKKSKIIHSNEFISNEFINWKKVANDFGGIECCPYIPVYKKYIWFSLWDVASGCVWNTESIIKKTELIYKRKAEKYIKLKKV